MRLKSFIRHRYFIEIERFEILLSDGTFTEYNSKTSRVAMISVAMSNAQSVGVVIQLESIVTNYNLTSGANVKIKSELTMSKSSDDGSIDFLSRPHGDTSPSSVVEPETSGNSQTDDRSTSSNPDYVQVTSASQKKQKQKRKQTIPVKRGTRVLQEIQRLQTSTENVIPKSSFQRFVLALDFRLQPPSTELYWLRFAYFTESYVRFWWTPVAIFSARIFASAVRHCWRCRNAPNYTWHNFSRIAALSHCIAELRRWMCGIWCSFNCCDAPNKIPGDESHSHFQWRRRWMINWIAVKPYITHKRKWKNEKKINFVTTGKKVPD